MCFFYEFVLWITTEDKFKHFHANDQTQMVILLSFQISKINPSGFLDGDK